MEDNFAQGASYQDLQGFRDYKVGKLDFTGPCPEIDSCSTLLIKADVEIDGDLVVDGTITFNGEIDFNINICNIGKYIHTSTLDANTFNIFNPTASTCGTLLGETAIIKTVMDGTIPQVQFTCDNGVGTDPPKIELRPNNGSSNISIFYDVNKDIITSAGTATQVANISTASTGDNIILAKDIITTSNDTTTMTSTNTTTISSTDGNIALITTGTAAGMGIISVDALQHIITAGFNVNKGKITIQGGPSGANMLFTNLSGTAVGSIDGPSLTNIPTINGQPAPCDRRVKDNIKKIDEKEKMERYNKLNKIDVVSYDYKNINGLLNINRHVDTGFTTQQLTSVGLDDCVVKQDEDAPQVPNTNAMIGLLINAVQVLQDKVKELEKEKPFTLKSHIV